MSSTHPKKAEKKAMREERLPSPYPSPSEEKKLKGKLLVFLGLSMMLILGGWILTWRYSFTPQKNQGSLFQEVGGETKGVLQTLREEFERLLKFLNNPPSGTDSNTERKEDPEIQELEEKVFPQFEE